MNYLTPEQVLFIHTRLIDEFGSEHGVRDPGILLASVERPQATYDDLDLYLNLYGKAAARIDSLIHNHPFLDGNMRTGIASASLFLSLNNVTLVASNEELIQFTMACARPELTIEEIATWLEKQSRTRQA
ncbi:MAG: type II toxin-antitoxin system death-on-curing family toxin [Anaerolineales bacterium]|jgi:death-on-curing protein